MKNGKPVIKKKKVTRYKRFRVSRRSMEKRKVN